MRKLIRAWRLWRIRQLVEAIEVNRALQWRGEGRDETPMLRKLIALNEALDS